MTKLHLTINIQVKIMDWKVKQVLQRWVPVRDGEESKRRG
jgi:hypothetical protein